MAEEFPVTSENASVSKRMVESYMCYFTPRLFKEVHLVWRQPTQHHCIDVCILTWYSYRSCTLGKLAHIGIYSNTVVRQKHCRELQESLPNAL